MVEDEELLLEVLNSAPVVDGVVIDALDGAAGELLATQFGGDGSAAELGRLREVRDALHEAIKGRQDSRHALEASMRDVVLRPQVTEAGLEWSLDAPPVRLLAARVALAWSRVSDAAPGRLKACANTECNLFLIDRSRPGTAKWCSMATCGNRMKARNHSQRRAGMA